MPKGRIAASIDFVTAPLRGGKASRRPQDADTIPFNLRCKKCSFNLRGLTPYSKCPECGTPVGQSLSQSGELKDAYERLFNALHNLGSAQRLSLALPGVVLYSGAMCCCLLGMAAIITVLAGTAQKLIALLQMYEARQDGPLGTGSKYRATVVLAIAEGVIGILFIFNLLMGGSSLAPAALADFVHPFLFAMWAGTMALGAVAAMILADSIADQHSVEVDSFPVPRPLVLLGPAFIAAALFMGSLSQFANSQPLQGAFVLLLIIGTLIWLAAGAIAGVHVTTVAIAIDFKTSLLGRKRDVPIVQGKVIQGEGAPAARPKPDDDDAPIPID